MEDLRNNQNRSDDDFRQTSPAIPRSTPIDVLNAYLKSAPGEETQEQRHRSNSSRRKVHRRKCFDTTCLSTIPTDLPFDFKRSQFPARLAFAMAISKSQGHLCAVVCLFGRMFVALTLEIHASRVNVSVNCVSPVSENHQLCLRARRQNEKKTRHHIVFQ